MYSDILIYSLVAIVGYLLAKLTEVPAVSPFFQEVVVKNIKSGKRVAIAIENEVTIFEMVDHKIRITRGEADFFQESTDGGNNLVIDGASEPVNNDQVVS